MITQEQINRINELSRKSKAEGLTEKDDALDLAAQLDAPDDEPDPFAQLFAQEGK